MALISRQIELHYRLNSRNKLKNKGVIKNIMQSQKVLTRMKKLEKEIRELRIGINSQTGISIVKPRTEMHKAALDFLKLKDIPDKIEISSVELVRKERKHARGY
jgi:hypothetical protein